MLPGCRMVLANLLLSILRVIAKRVPSVRLRRACSTACDICWNYRWRLFMLCRSRAASRPPVICPRNLWMWAVALRAPMDQSSRWRIILLYVQVTTWREVHPWKKTPGRWRISQRQTIFPTLRTHQGTSRGANSLLIFTESLTSVIISMDLQEKGAFFLRLLSRTQSQQLPVPCFHTRASMDQRTRLSPSGVRVATWPTTRSYLTELTTAFWPTLLLKATRRRATLTRNSMDTRTKEGLFTSSRPRRQGWFRGRRRCICATGPFG